MCFPSKDLDSLREELKQINKRRDELLVQIDAREHELGKAYKHYVKSVLDKED